MGAAGGLSLLLCPMVWGAGAYHSPQASEQGRMRCREPIARPIATSNEGGAGLTYVERTGFETRDRVGKQWLVTFLPGGCGSHPGMVNGSLVSKQRLVIGWWSAAGWVGLHCGGLQGGQPGFQSGYLNGLLLHLSCHVMWGSVGGPTGQIRRGGAHLEHCHGSTGVAGMEQVSLGRQKEAGCPSGPQTGVGNSGGRH